MRIIAGEESIQALFSVFNRLAALARDTQSPFTPQFGTTTRVGGQGGEIAFYAYFHDGLPPNIAMNIAEGDVRLWESWGVQLERDWKP